MGLALTYNEEVIQPPFSTRDGGCGSGDQKALFVLFLFLFELFFLLLGKFWFFLILFFGLVFVAHGNLLGLSEIVWSMFNPGHLQKGTPAVHFLIL